MPLTTDKKLLALSRETIQAFDKVNGGVHPGFRPAHAKGILLTGSFTPSAEAASLTRRCHGPLARGASTTHIRGDQPAGKHGEQRQRAAANHL
jgi:catalase